MSPPRGAQSWLLCVAWKVTSKVIAAITGLRDRVNLHRHAAEVLAARISGGDASIGGRPAENGTRWARGAAGDALPGVADGKEEKSGLRRRREDGRVNGAERGEWGGIGSSGSQFSTSRRSPDAT